ncbi:MAG: hypothetical protein QG573_29 [Acidobacteriota bacterium]|nr:hypothetical protein [Acidobacteriota bacterium]
MKTRNEMARLYVCMTMTLGMLAAMPVQAAGPAPVDLGKANNLVLLAKTGISPAGRLAPEAAGRSTAILGAWAKWSNSLRV